jgi:hypothetical protein
LTKPSTSERIEIEWTCTHLTHRFAQLLDARDFEPLTALFARNGALFRPSAPDDPIVGHVAILAAYRARPGGKITQHFITNTVITADNTEQAHGVCYIQLYSAVPNEGSGEPPRADPVHSLGHYHDRFIKEDGIWKFLERRGSISMTVGG